MDLAFEPSITGLLLFNSCNIESRSVVEPSFEISFNSSSTIEVRMLSSKDSMVHIQDKAALFQEIKRVLIPGGVFVTSDWLSGKQSFKNHRSSAGVDPKRPLTYFKAAEVDSILVCKWYMPADGVYRPVNQRVCNYRHS